MKNKISFILFIALLLSMNLFSQDKKLPQLVAVKQVDLKRYAGLWYEIAKIPNSFQNQCSYGTTAEYKLLKDGTIEVINKCFEKNGKADIADGVAQVVDKKTNSKLEVSFFSILGIRPFWGDYWIIGLDDNYQWAVVGSPNRKYGWILSRTPSLPEETMQYIFSLLQDQHYNPAKFEMTSHKNQALKNTKY